MSGDHDKSDVSNHPEFLKYSKYMVIDQQWWGMDLNKFLLTYSRCVAIHVTVTKVAFGKSVQHLYYLLYR